MEPCDELARLIEAVRANAKYRPITAALVRRVGAQELCQGTRFERSGQSHAEQAAPGGRGLPGGPGSIIPAWRAELEQLPGDLHDPLVMAFAGE